MTSVSVKTVKQKLDAILDHLLENDLHEIGIDAKLYWAISDTEKYALDKDPELEVGDVAFDAELIANIGEPLALELLYFSEVLRLIAFEGSKRNL